jgi:outer membrane protein assembly factor BamD (BamD/ComL family)
MVEVQKTLRTQASTIRRTRTRTLGLDEGDAMKHRTVAAASAACILFCLSLGAALAQVADRATSVRSTPSDKVMFANAQKAMANSHYAEARTLLDTLISKHPDSSYVPRAKLSIADAWFSEGNFEKAELEYNDFVTFFPNRPEAAKAQSKIDFIHRRAN